MASTFILASASEIRAQVLARAGLSFDVKPARVDEASLRAAFAAEQMSPRDQADALAEFKARRVAQSNPDRMVLGCDQILALGDVVYGKPRDAAEACQHIAELAGATHALYSALVLFDEGRPVWRHVETVKLTMRPLPEAWISDYVARNWDSIQHSVGGYKIEEEGIRLFSRIDGDYFAILGMPLLPLLSYLSIRGVIDP